MKRRLLIAGNWKMNGLSSDLVEIDAMALAAAPFADHIDVVVCPPATLLMAAAPRCAVGMLGAQDCHHAEKGAFTGAISAPQLRDAGVRHVIVGHSERRQYCGETDAMVAAKAAAALGAGLSVMLCVGETLPVRDAGMAEAFVLDQLAASLPDAAAMAITDQTLAVAYEPRWAIGTGRTASTDDVAAMHQAIRRFIADRFGAPAGEALRILYGGSVTGETAPSLLALDDVDGALVGGASLLATSFAAIIAAAAKVAAVKR